MDLIPSSSSSDLPTPADASLDAQEKQSVPKHPSYEWTKNSELVQRRIKKLTWCAYPGYRGRKFKLDFRKSYQLQNYWDGGTKHYAVAVDLTSDTILEPHKDTTNPFKISAAAEIDIPLGYAILEMCVFCGKNLGITLILPPLPPALPSKEASK